MFQRRPWLAPVLIALAVAAAYANALRAPFVFDDLPAIVDNPTIRKLWPLSVPLSPPSGGLPVSGRPLPNLTLALNHAIGGLEPWSYHAGNVALHALTAIVLFAVLQRTLRRPVWPARVRETAAPLALAIALLWALHPLQTAAVSYVVQRTEILASLFYLLTLLGFIRAVEDPSKATRWQTLAVVGCVFGMASKEIMATAPLIVLLYDRTFVAGSFRAAWRARSRLYLSLAATWLLLGVLVLGTQSRGGTAGFGLNISPLEYALTQTQAIVRYLALTVWPHPLVFDYGSHVARGAVAIVPFVLILALLLAGVAWALWRRPVIGFAGAMFFAVLAPSSSIVPVATQTMAEHRMYLPLAAILSLFGVGICCMAGSRARRVLTGVAAVLALTWAGLTVRRNTDFRTAEKLWRDSVAKFPTNARAHNNLAAMLLESGRREEAFPALEEALRLQPGFPDALRNYSQALLQAERVTEALARAEEALKLDPRTAASHNTHGIALLRLNRHREAAAAFREAVRIDPAHASAYTNLGYALRQLGELEAARHALLLALENKPQLAEAHHHLGQVWLAMGQPQAAIAEFEQALRLKPGASVVHQALASALFGARRPDEAIKNGREAVRLAPDSFEAHYNFGTDLSDAGFFDEAIEELRAAVRLRPQSAEARYNLGNALARGERLDEAIVEYREARRLAPKMADVQFNLGNALMRAGRAAEALPCFQAVLLLEKPTPAIHCAIGFALAELGRLAEAVAEFRAALRLDPNHAPAREALRMMGAGSQ